MKTVTLPGGETVPALGQGTWRMGENKGRRQREVAALRLGIDLGMTLIDTAEMYGDGGAEKVVGEAIDGRRDRVFIVTKAYPQNASRRLLPKPCENSLKRLRIEAIDLYLLHWRGAVPLAETVETFEQLRAAGKIRRWGVSNFDLDDMEDLWAVANGSRCACNQVLYNLENRGIEFDLVANSQPLTLPPSRRSRSLASNPELVIMAYSPVGHGRGLLSNRVLAEIAQRHETSTAQIALAWVLRQSGVIAIPKSSNIAHVRDNAAALEIRLTENDLAELDREFPPPTRKVPLAML